MTVHICEQEIIPFIALIPYLKGVLLWLHSRFMPIAVCLFR